MLICSGVRRHKDFLIPLFDNERCPMVKTKTFAITVFGTAIMFGYKGFATIKTIFRRKRLTAWFLWNRFPAFCSQGIAVTNKPKIVSIAIGFAPWLNCLITVRNGAGSPSFFGHSIAAT